MGSVNSCNSTRRNIQVACGINELSSFLKYRSTTQYLGISEHITASCCYQQSHVKPWGPPSHVPCDDDDWTKCAFNQMFPRPHLRTAHGAQEKSDHSRLRKVRCQRTTRRELMYCSVCTMRCDRPGGFIEWTTATLRKTVWPVATVSAS